MWDDYQAGIKPAKVIALMYEHGASITICSREELRERCKAVDGDGWLYFACKAVQHGSNYGMQEKTMSTNIMKQSYKITGTAVHVEPAICASLQRLYFLRYPGLYQWHEWAKTQVFDNKNLSSASGNTRVFFGRRKSFNSRRRCMEADQDTWKSFLSHEPQANTTYATNLALYNLLRDPDNRDPQSRGFVIEPLHQVHDALIGQFPRERTEWAVEKIRQYFNNPLQIANSTVVIPFEGAYGPSWGEQGPKYGGGDI
jgi:DNA polymerase I-like protein with 3'-5' exonuclease and polymerase domains